MEKIKVKRAILFQISYFRKSVVKKLRASNYFEFKQVKDINSLSQMKMISNKVKDDVLC